MKIHPTTYICYLLLIISLLLNLSFYRTQQKLVYKIQKLECGSWDSIFKKEYKRPNNPNVSPFKIHKYDI